MNRLLISLVILIAAASPAFANRAQTLILPQRIIMNNSDRFATMLVKNAGDATGQFRIDVIDMDMKEDGTINELPQGTPPTEFSAIPIVRLSPRSVTLKPGEGQTVRILLRKPEGLADGEYRSHVKVSIINDNVDGIDDGQPKPMLSVTPKIVLIIPLIVRSGQTSFTSSLSEPKIIRNSDGTSALSIYIGREGNRSSMGDLKIFQNGREVGSLVGVPVYRPTARRLVRVPLTGASGGPLTIRYMQQASETTGTPAMLAETTLP